MFDINNYSLIELLVIALAVFRLSTMIVNEDGFLSFAFAIRLLGSKVVSKEPINKFVAWKTSLSRSGDVFTLLPVNHFGQLVSCIWCTSVWVAFILFPSYYYLQDTVFSILYYSLALSAVTIFINRFM